MDKLEIKRASKVKLTSLQVSFLANNLHFMVKLIDKAIVINVKIHKNAGLSFEAGCRGNSTSSHRHR
jgi:hypothetical protein